MIWFCNVSSMYVFPSFFFQFFFCSVDVCLQHLVALGIFLWFVRFDAGAFDINMWWAVWCEYCSTHNQCKVCRVIWSRFFYTRTFSSFSFSFSCNFCSVRFAFFSAFSSMKYCLYTCYKHTHTCINMRKREEKTTKNAISFLGLLLFVHKHWNMCLLLQCSGYSVPWTRISSWDIRDKHENEAWRVAPIITTAKQTKYFAWRGLRWSRANLLCVSWLNVFGVCNFENLAVLTKWKIPAN